MPYMSEDGDGSDLYKLYAVIVHLDMLNASYFGHYICYIKDFSGNWYRIDDSEVESVELEVVLSQRAYMLLYSRVQARSSSSSSCLRTEVQDEKVTNPWEMTSCQKELVESSMLEAIDSRSSSHANIEDPEPEQGSPSSLSAPSSSSSVVTSECCREVERVNTMDSESTPSVFYQEDAAANGYRDPEVQNHAVVSSSTLTASTSLVCKKSGSDMHTEMIDAQ